MKRFLIWLLSAAMILSLAACGGEETTIGAEQTRPEQTKTEEPSETGIADPQVLAVKTAEYPALPAMPDEAELDKELGTLDHDKMGKEAFQKAYNEIWDDWNTRNKAYSDACEALRSEGTAYPGAFAQFTEQTGTLLSARDNTVLSPANLYLAFAMLSETADGDSRGQILSLLGLDDTDAAREAGNYVWRNLYSETVTGETRLGSSIWLNENVPYNEETLQVLAEQYLASTFSAPMGEEQTNQAIAEWINENTGDLLQDAAGGIQTDPDTVMLLLTTLIFKDHWVDDFPEDATAQDVFTSADGEKQTVDFMHRTDDRAAYCRGENYTVAELSFRGGESMRILLPDEGTTLEDLISDGGVVDGLMAYDDASSDAVIQWSVPKFDVASNLDLTDALRVFGVQDVFDIEKADFSPLVDGDNFEDPIAVTQVRHAARVKVDEEGCEAAAYTAVLYESEGMAPEDLSVVEMNLNRPFAFLITGVDGLPLFLGTVNTLV